MHSSYAVKIQICHYASDKKCTVSVSKCIKNNLATALRPDPLGSGAYSAPPDPLAGFRGGKKERGEKQGKG